jgi:hypothetical protein
MKPAYRAQTDDYRIEIQADDHGVVLSHRHALGSVYVTPPNLHRDTAPRTADLERSVRSIDAVLSLLQGAREWLAKRCTELAKPAAPPEGSTVLDAPLIGKVMQFFSWVESRPEFGSNARSYGPVVESGRIVKVEAFLKDGRSVICGVTETDEGGGRFSWTLGPVLAETRSRAVRPDVLAETRSPPVDLTRVVD